MESKIDWSKAPADADKYNTHNGMFYAGERPYLQVFIHEQWMPSAIMKSNELFVYRPTTTSWSGKGLPPVGVKVLIMNPEQFAITDYGQEFVGEECTVRAVFVNDLDYMMVAVEKVGGACCCFISEMCFPIRTPEQIAADEREAAIKRACADIDKLVSVYNMSIDCSAAIRATIEALHDAGYRKP